MKELKIINSNLYFFGLVLFHFTREVYLQNVYISKDSGLQTPLTPALHWCLLHPWFLSKYFHSFGYSLAYLCPQILWFLKKRDMVLSVIPHVLCIMFFCRIKCPSFCLPKHFSTCEDISKHSILSADALMPCVLQTLLLSICALTHNTSHQNQPVLASATSHSCYH